MSRTGICFLQAPLALLLRWVLFSLQAFLSGLARRCAVLSRRLRWGGAAAASRSRPLAVACRSQTELRYIGASGGRVDDRIELHILWV